MAKESEPKESPKGKVTIPFYKRFNIEVGLEQAKENFLNRTLNLIEFYFPELEKPPNLRAPSYDDTLRLMATELGVRYNVHLRFHDYCKGDFVTLLQTLEAFYKVYELRYNFEELVIIEAMSKSEVDLGVEWRDGIFLKNGAKLLDQDLLNQNLEWLADPKYSSVLEPFKKGLGHWMEAQNRPERLKDIITEMYEALEALAKIVTGNDKDLSANRESFVSALKLGEYHKKLLKDYIEYANEYRHALKPGEKRIQLIPNEVEAYFYLTGLFVRLAIQQLNQKAIELDSN